MITFKERIEGTHSGKKLPKTQLFFCVLAELQYAKQEGADENGFVQAGVVKRKLAELLQNKGEIKSSSQFSQYITGKVDRGNPNVVFLSQNVDFLPKDPRIGDEKTHYKIKEELLEEIHNYIIENNLIPKLTDDVIQLFSQEMNQKQLKGGLQDMDIEKETNENTTLGNFHLNMILYGVPGTGKTFSTIKRAVEIIDGAGSTKNLDYQQIKKRYEELKQSKQIMFTTFHQSYGYEDFIEGIRAVTENGAISYRVESGVFKEISNIANSHRTLRHSSQDDVIDVDKVNIFKISLGQADQDQDVYDYCIDNNVITIGYGDIDFSSLPNTQGYAQAIKQIKDFINSSGSEDTSKFTADAIFRFKNWIQQGDLVFVSKGNSYLRAIGKVVGDYEYIENTEIGFKHFRKVEWIVKDIEIPVETIQPKKFSQQSIYSLKDDGWKKSLLYMDAIKELIGNTEKKEKRFVLIIDEINRGNISKVFGELITLIEPSKRLGNSDNISAKLPYSKEDFGVPNNLYIIGTMNTADKSIALMDLALRRRFSFEEMKPDSSTLDLFVGNINIKEMFETINHRIMYLLDQDHLLGHALFLELKKESNLQTLNKIFLNNIIPLLQEYFYDDYEKIQIILGDHQHQGLKDREDQIYQIITKPSNVLGMSYDDLEEKNIYQVNPALCNNTISERAYIGIYQSNK